MNIYWSSVWTPHLTPAFVHRLSENIDQSATEVFIHSAYIGAKIARCTPAISWGPPASDPVCVAVRHCFVSLPLCWSTGVKLQPTPPFVPSDVFCVTAQSLYISAQMSLLLLHLLSRANSSFLSVSSLTSHIHDSGVSAFHCSLVQWSRFNLETTILHSYWASWREVRTSANYVSSYFTPPKWGQWLLASWESAGDTICYSVNSQ